MANHIPVTDPASLFYLHSNETLGVLISSPILNGKNYHVWSRTMMWALNAKNKFLFIHGSILKPDREDPIFFSWDRCNMFVLSWIMHSLSDAIKESVMWRNVALDVWKE